MKLIMFFNGWGMDKSIHPEIDKKNEYELISLSFPYTISNIDLHKYEHIYIIGWSFGVYYANIYLEKIEKENLKNITSIAINGTPEIIGKNGIKKNMMKYTLDNLTPESLEKFYMNMELPKLLMNVDKNFTDIKSELKYILENYEVLKNNFQKAIISQEDRIVSPENQRKYFTENNVEIKEIAAGHYPFEYFRNFEEILNGWGYGI
ncbi:MAG: pimeloyl-ACP methyl esterase BioG family protein [Fusobacteriaceae bacterium]